MQPLIYAVRQPPQKCINDTLGGLPRFGWGQDNTPFLGQGRRTGSKQRRLWGEAPP